MVTQLTAPLEGYVKPGAPDPPPPRLTVEAIRTSDIGYEPPSRTDQDHPDCVTGSVSDYVPPTYSPPDDPDHWIEGYGADRSGPHWDAPPFEIEDDETSPPRYAIIEDMGSLFRDLCDDVLETTSKFRSDALKWLCRAIAGAIGTVVLTLLLIGGLGVVLAVGLFRFLDWAELAYWVGRDQP